jgi:hypothetical protein
MPHIPGGQGLRVQPLAAMTADRRERQGRSAAQSPLRPFRGDPGRGQGPSPTPTPFRILPSPDRGRRDPGVILPGGRRGYLPAVQAAPSEAYRLTGGGSTRHYKHPGPGRGEDDRRHTGRGQQKDVGHHRKSAPG